MKYVRSNKGVTLIELIISIAILGIIIAAFLPMFTGSVVNIYNFGERYQYFSQVQGALEKELSKEYDEVSTGISENDIDDKIQIIITVIERNDNDTLNIKIPDFNEENIQVTGKEIEVKAVYKDDGKVLTTLTSFMPDPDFLYSIEN